jgi:hypothetical protein
MFSNIFVLTEQTNRRLTDSTDLSDLTKNIKIKSCQNKVGELTDFNRFWR